MRARVKVEVALDENLPAIAGGRQYLSQVFVNLLLNAVDAMPEGGTVHISAAGQPGRRTEVRRAVQSLGLVEGESFLCVA